MARVVGRFAPTPSGYLHLGNLFCSLIAWLAAKSQGGDIILRNEDLDRERTRQEYVLQARRDLDALGLFWDQGGKEGGPHAPYDQSQRFAFYRAQLAQLEARGLCYPCFCSRAQLHAASAPHASDGELLYSGACRDLTPAQVAEKSRTRSPALRLRVPEETIAFTDLHYGPQQQYLPTGCGDFILRRSDGVYAYQLAVVTDDADGGVTEIVRGRDLLSSTPRQLWLQETLGFAHPAYYHVPLLTAPDGRRLSKREKDLDLGALRQRLSPQEVLGQLAYLAGLQPEPVPVSAAELAGRFSWDQVTSDNIVIHSEFT